MQPTRALTSEGLALLKDFEGTVRCKNNARLQCPYNDASKFCTIGYGHLIARAPCNKLKLKLREMGFLHGITEDRAHELLAGDLSEAQRGVERHITNELMGITALTAFQYDALVSLTFNIGAENFAQSTLLRLARKRKAVSEDRAIANAFSLWVKSDGVVLEGLISRRAAEARHFFKNVKIDFALEDGAMIDEEKFIDIRLGERRSSVE
jgi:lysozyme